MFKKIILISALLLTSCISMEVDSNSAVTAVPDFVTSTLPPTKQSFVPATLTPEAILSPTVAITAPPDCKDGAVLLRDVTIQDDTQVRANEEFTKTWEFQNTGSCPWINYTLVFAAGDPMGAPLSAPIPVTASNEKVQVSVDLTAPASNGMYTGYFTLHNSSDKIVPIGAEQTFWVKIVVGSSSSVPTTSGTLEASPTQSGSTTTGESGGSANCNYTQNAGYVNQVAALINAERANAGLSALTINAQLAAAAQAHAADMACNDMISHSGSGGSSAYSRVLASGYSGMFSEEIIYGGGGPQAAISWWMSDQIHRDAILKAKSTEMGVGYAYYSNGAYGDFIVVDLGSQ